jgi:hypothetical protein
MIRLNPLGATNVMVSRLGLGMAALGRPSYINFGENVHRERSAKHEGERAARARTVGSRHPLRRCGPLRISATEPGECSATALRAS